MERLTRIYPPRVAEAALQTFRAARPTTLRVNTLRATVEEVRRALHTEGFQVERVPWYAEALLLKDRSVRELTATAVYERGQLYVQSLSSMLPPLVLAPQPGEMVLDVTAAPGSKTTQMAALMQNHGTMVANDNIQPRFAKLLANVTRQGATCVQCVRSPGETVWRRYGEVFDRVLVDAPCSAEGRFDTRDPRSYRYWKLTKIHEMVRTQKRLLYSAMRSLKPGGTLVYSTCTFAPEENEGVVSWALERFGDVLTSIPCRVPVVNTARPLARWEGKTFVLGIRRAIRILPTATMEGFFVAAFQKVQSYST